MAHDINVTASVQLTAQPNASGVPPGPSCGPFPFSFSEVGVGQPLTNVTQVVPGDTFVGAEKVVDIPAHFRRLVPATDPARQVYLLIKTDLPVKVRVRDDNPAGAVTMERTLGVGGHISIAGGGPDVDQITFEGVATSSPLANVSIWLVART